MAEIIPIQTGGTLVSPAVPNRNVSRNPFAYTGLFSSRKKRILVPVKCFLAKSAGHTVLVDTGWGTADVDHAKDHLGIALWFASEPVLNVEETALRQLGRMGIKPKDLDAVVFTHLDVDHIAGAEDFKGTKVMYADEKEIEDAYKGGLRYNKKLAAHVILTALPMADDKEAPFEKSCDLFGDGSFVVYQAPGHSHGSVIVKVTDLKTGKYILITGDSGYNKDSWDKLNLPGPVADKEIMLEALRWVAAQRTDKDCVGVYAAHDPEKSVKPFTF